MYVNPTWELKYLGEDAGGVLVETPEGKQVMMSHSHMTNYAKVGNMLIPKKNIEWLG